MSNVRSITIPAAGRRGYEVSCIDEDDSGDEGKGGGKGVKVCVK